jgi:hypothetical protein
MKCPNCLSDKLLPTNKLGDHWWHDFPSFLLVSRVRCDTCLTHFYRLRGVGILIRRGTNICCPF